jgi:Zn-dependent peptidase ImmA (M78 family)
MDSIFEIVERYWNHAPVDIISIIHDAGIVYLEEPLWPHESGLIDRSGGGYRIIVNSDHSSARRRFTAAHELGHYAYHRDLIGEGISDAAYRTLDVGRYRYFNPKITQRHETQANNFAAATLMPDHLLERLKQKYFLPAQVTAMAEKLQVSEQALRIRLGL